MADRTRLKTVVAEVADRRPVLKSLAAVEAEAHQRTKKAEAVEVALHWIKKGLAEVAVVQLT